jgi:hypothetical protein
VNNDASHSDNAPAGGQAETGQLEDNVKSRSTWLRLFFMIVVSLLYGVSRLVVGMVVVLQFFWVLFTGNTNPSLDSFAQSLATYTYQIIRYLTFVSDERPFPFDADWPVGPPTD